MSAMTGVIGFLAMCGGILGSVLQKPDFVQAAGVMALLTIVSVIDDLILELRLHR